MKTIILHFSCDHLTSNKYENFENSLCNDQKNWKYSVWKFKRVLGSFFSEQTY